MHVRAYECVCVHVRAYECVWGGGGEGGGGVFAYFVCFCFVLEVQAEITFLNVYWLPIGYLQDPPTHPSPPTHNVLLPFFTKTNKRTNKQKNHHYVHHCILLHILALEQDILMMFIVYSLP